MYLRIFKDYFEVQPILTVLILRGRFSSLGDCTNCEVQGRTELETLMIIQFFI